MNFLFCCSSGIEAFAALLLPNLREIAKLRLSSGYIICSGIIYDFFGDNLNLRYWSWNLNKLFIKHLFTIKGCVDDYKSHPSGYERVFTFELHPRFWCLDVDKLGMPHSMCQMGSIWPLSEACDASIVLDTGCVHLLYAATTTRILFIYFTVQR